MNKLDHFPQLMGWKFKQYLKATPVVMLWQFVADVAAKNSKWLYWRGAWSFDSDTKSLGGDCYNHFVSTKNMCCQILLPSEKGNDFSKIYEQTQHWFKGCLFFNIEVIVSWLVFLTLGRNPRKTSDWVESFFKSRILRRTNSAYTALKLKNNGKTTIWRCISYETLWLFLVMLYGFQGCTSWKRPLGKGNASTKRHVVGSMLVFRVGAQTEWNTIGWP